MTNQLRGSFIATGNIRNTTTGCHDYPLPLLFSMCRAAIESNNRMLLHGDQRIRVNLNRVRDHVLTMKGFRYFATDLTSFLDLILETQTETGFFYEIIAPLTDSHSSNHGPDYSLKKALVWPGCNSKSISNTPWSKGSWRHSARAAYV